MIKHTHPYTKKVSKVSLSVQKDQIKKSNRGPGSKQSNNSYLSSAEI